MKAFACAGKYHRQYFPETTGVGTTLEFTFTVLVAEGNKRLGCRVDLASDGRSVIDRLEANSYDIVLMDLSMPEMDGMETARRIRRMAGAKSAIPIVALTASVSSGVRSQCLEAGITIS